MAINFADYFIRGYEQGQARGQRQRRLGLLEKIEEQRRMDEVISELDKANQTVHREVVPFEEGLNLVDGAQIFSGSEYEQGFSGLIGRASGFGLDADLLPDEQKYVYKDDIIRPSNPSEMITVREDDAISKTYGLEPGEYSSRYIDDVYNAYEANRLTKRGSAGGKDAPKDLDGIREKVVSQFTAYQQLEDEKPKKLQFNLMKNNVRELVNQSGIKSAVNKVDSLIRSGDSFSDALQKGSEGLSESQKSDMELYYTILPPKGAKVEEDTGGMMDRESFIKDFEKERGRKPYEREIEIAKGELWQ